MKAPSDMQGAGRYAVLRDPQGAVFAVINPENARPESMGVPAMGTFSWHELATTDHEAAFAFYSGLFGWDAITRMDMGPTGIYLIFGWKGQQRGGMYTKPADAPMPSNWLPYAFVPSADKAYAWATTSGGREMLPPMDVPGGSRIAGIMDPSGAAFAVNSPAPAAQAGAPKEKAAAKPKAKAKPKQAAKPKAKKKVVKKAAKKAAKKSAKRAPKKKAAAKKKTAAKKKSSKGARRKK
jgi:predicted enzyme related to lactoylglutathione lyase